MYHEEKCVSITCDNCGETYTNDHSGFSWFPNNSDAYEEAGDDGWHETEDEKHYCPDCHEIDDDDNLIIKPKPTPHP